MLADLIHQAIPRPLRPMNYLTELVQRRTHLQISGGPFRGLRYANESHCSMYLPKLLGLYERELAPCVEEACALGLGRIIDVGAAEGYYAAGMALRNPRAEVIAFEMAEAGRTQLAATLRLNDLTDRIIVRGKCEPLDLREALGGPDTSTLVICDAEGYELDLLDPELVPALGQAWILAELHEFWQRGVTEALPKRFADTHEVHHIWQTPRTPTDFPYQTWYTRVMPVSRLAWAVSEGRLERMSWLWMKPRTRPGAS